MDQDEIDKLRRQAGRAYARWRACDAQRPRDQASDAESRRLKSELDLAALALFSARRPSLTFID